MALFFKKRRPATRPRTTEEDFWKDHANVPRGTGVPLPTGPRRAHYDLAEDAGWDDEYGEEILLEEQTPPRLPRPEEPRVFVVANQKGGVGKTTTTVNLAMGLALGGLNVLVIDNDPQGNASTALGVDHPNGTPGTYEVLVEGDSIMQHAQVSPHSRNLHVLPAVVDLAAAEMELAIEHGREAKLKHALDSYIEQSGVDYVFIDCPPSLGMLTLNALVAATEILVPIQAEYYALEGVTALLRTIERVKGNLNERLELTNILLTMYDKRTNLAKDVAAEVRSHFPDQTLSVEIPRSVRVAEAPSFGQTVLTYQPRSEGAAAYVQAVEELAHQVKTKE